MTEEQAPKSNFQLFSGEMLDRISKETQALAFELGGQITDKCVSYLDTRNGTNIKKDIEEVSFELFEISKKLKELSRDIYKLKENEINR